MVFEGCFENTNRIQMMTRLSNDISYCLYLQGPLTHLGGEWRATYIAVVFRQILMIHTNKYEWMLLQAKECKTIS